MNSFITRSDACVFRRAVICRPTLQTCFRRPSKHDALKLPRPHTRRSKAFSKDEETSESISENRTTTWERLCFLSNRVAENFAWIVVISCSFALFYPSPFLGFQTNMVTTALAVSMLAMGCTLKLEDFAILTKHPIRILIGVVLQYTIMPITGFVISRTFPLIPSVAAGVVLVSCCPGGVASNIVTYLAAGDVPLSVAMTAISTLLAIGLTPILTATLLGTLVPVDGWSLFLSTLQVILLPLVMGVAVKTWFPKTVQKLQGIAPLIAVIAVTCINCSITARHAEMLLQSGLTILTSVAALHLTGFALGYILSAFMGLPPRCCTTISIEVGMQNSGLGAVLAMKHFSDPLTSCACVVSACFHSIAGGFLATFARRMHDHNPN